MKKLLMVMAVLVGCSPTPAPPPRGEFLGGRQVAALFHQTVHRRFDSRVVALTGGSLPEMLANPVEVTDSLYFAPSVSDVQNLIGLVQNDMLYRPEVYDCDDFARYFKAEMARQWAKQGHMLPLPVFEVHAMIYSPKEDQLLAHAFNAIMTSEGKVIFIEPQANEVIAFAHATPIAMFYVGL